MIVVVVVDGSRLHVYNNWYLYVSASLQLNDMGVLFPGGDVHARKTNNPKEHIGTVYTLYTQYLL